MTVRNSKKTNKIHKISIMCANFIEKNEVKKYLDTEQKENEIEMENRQLIKIQ